MPYHAHKTENGWEVSRSDRKIYTLPEFITFSRINRLMATLNSSKHVKNQKQRHTKTVETESDGKVDITVTIRHDDQCGNGKNDFSVTGEIYRHGRHRTDRNLISCGCIHDDIKQFFPEFAHMLKWHLCSIDSPMHYVANTTYHVSDRDCWGLRKGEKRQIKNGRTGKHAWLLRPIDAEGNEIKNPLEKSVDADEKPTDTVTFGYVPWYREGEGKEINLDAARRCAVWSEATLEELQDEQKLRDRLPELLSEFQSVIESLGFEF